MRPPGPGVERLPRRVFTSASGKSQVKPGRNNPKSQDEEQKTNRED